MAADQAADMRGQFINGYLLITIVKYMLPPRQKAAYFWI